MKKKTLQTIQRNVFHTFSKIKKICFCNKTLTFSGKNEFHLSKILKDPLINRHMIDRGALSMIPILFNRPEVVTRLLVQADNRGLKLLV